MAVRFCTRGLKNSVTKGDSKYCNFMSSRYLTTGWRYTGGLLAREVSYHFIGLAWVQFQIISTGPLLVSAVNSFQITVVEDTADWSKPRAFVGKNVDSLSATFVLCCLQDSNLLANYRNSPLMDTCLFLKAQNNALQCQMPLRGLGQ